MIVRNSPEEVYSAFWDMAFDVLHNHIMPPKSVISRIRSWDVSDPAVLEQARAYIDVV